MRDFVRADDHLERILEPGDAEPAYGAAPHLAGDEAESLATIPQRPHRLHNAVIRTHQLIVVGEVVGAVRRHHGLDLGGVVGELPELYPQRSAQPLHPDVVRRLDRKSTRLNSSHGYISYAVFCLKKKKKTKNMR